MFVPKLKYKEQSPRRVVILPGEGRFGGSAVKGAISNEKAQATPAPTSYDIEGAFDFANTFRGREKFAKSKRVSFCVSAAKLAISPGPAKHNHSIKLLDKLSPSP